MHTTPMKHALSASGIAALALILWAASSPAHAQYYDMPHPTDHPANASFNGREPMPMMRFDARQEHRRQSAKCMNAYPEDHSGFTSCIRDENASSPFRHERMQFMPMPPTRDQQ